MDISNPGNSSDRNMVPTTATWDGFSGFSIKSKAASVLLSGSTEPIVFQSGLRKDFLFYDAVESFCTFGKHLDTKVRRAFDPLIGDLVHSLLREKNDVRLINVDIIEIDI